MTDSSRLEKLAIENEALQESKLILQRGIIELNACSEISELENITRGKDGDKIVIR